MDNLKLTLFLIILSTVSSNNDLDWNFCGTWRHGRDPLNLNLNISTGCKGIDISANENVLSVTGRITAQCERSEVISLNQLGLSSGGDIDFCLYWEPLLDQLKLTLGGQTLALCWPSSLQDSCCTDLTDGPKTKITTYGIFNTRIKTDHITNDTLMAYNFNGGAISYSELCEQANRESEDNKCAEPPYAHRSEAELKEDFRGRSITSPAIEGRSFKSSITIHLPPALKQAAKKANKVACTFFKNNSLLQEGHKDAKPISDVVEITVENEIIKDLSEPITIDFYHEVVSERHSRRCVSWDTRKDSLQVNWLDDGCETQHRGESHTVCLCNHLTYFTVLVDLNPAPVRHLAALTAITYLGCAVSVISCVALIVYLCRKRRSKEQSLPIHLGLAVSLAFLSLIFFFTGIMANVGGESVCTWVGAVLHYALLSSFLWMGIEVLHTFWLVYMLFTPHLKPYIWILVGFVLPAVPVVIMAAVGNIYGMIEVTPSDDPSNPYKMCWMKLNEHEAWLAFCLTNITLLALLVSSGIVMLFLVYRQIRTREEWKQNRVAFLSIWGLSCLFGTTWGLTFLKVEPLSTVILFLSCILNSFQGFFLMLRFCMLDWMRKQAGGSSLGSSSTGSTRQHMLQAQEKS
ncbi:adhesion G-protein coupled receptor G1 isoform X2 [Archocentrus centrarchus]|uniref:adhesion G-protein coupled receptor G1 isoform X2 n=1 Tax=Archocentrus centrarchus TaxID=63155 RepID=UPI0011EA1CAE|nr:adhesion G-protein coupled receptor G5-like isoform X2 [Archocentrus centrarchus]